MLAENKYLEYCWIMEKKIVRGSAKGSTNGGNIGRRTNPNAGRKKGVPNKRTAEMRERISQFVNATFDEAVSLWRRVAEDKPDKALDQFIELIEFNTARLTRTEISGPDGGAIQQAVSIVINPVRAVGRDQPTD